MELDTKLSEHLISHQFAGESLRVKLFVELGFAHASHFFTQQHFLFQFHQPYALGTVDGCVYSIGRAPTSDVPWQRAHVSTQSTHRLSHTPQGRIHRRSFGPNPPPR